MRSIPILLAALGAASLAAQEREQELLAPARIAALPAAQRAAWERYLAESKRLGDADRAVMAAELRQAGLEKATPAPRGDGFNVEPRMTGEYWSTPEARQVADAIVSFQTPAGGWSKRMEFTRPRRPGESWASEGNWSWVGTLDNNSTTSQLRFLGGVGAATRDERYRASFRKGLEYLYRAQFPNGCWPQVYPLVGGYHDAVTYNDDAIVNVLRVLQDVAQGALGAAEPAERQRAANSFRRGVECILASQVVVDGRRTAWGQQHDPLTLKPARARAYEHASLAGRESAAIVNLLLTVENPQPRLVTAVRGAVQWFRDTAVYGYEYSYRGGLTAKPGAGPIWARFYEIGTNRPMFSNRDGVVRYRFEELDPERSRGYAWYGDEPATTLRRYERWARTQPTARAEPARTHTVVVDAAHRGGDGAAVRGVQTYRTIAAALAAAPDDSAPYIVNIRDGRYREKLTVDRPNVRFVGQSRERTVLTYDAAAGHLSPGGWPYGTRGTFTLRVAAPDFRLERMTVENAFDYLANNAKAESDSTKIQGSQAVAVMLDEGSDRAVFRECAITGHQDTLFPNAGRSYFNRCTVSGSVDFIFGAGVAVFEDSDIISRDRGSATSNGFITAPSTLVSQPHGFLFLRSRLKKEKPAMAPASVTLGRPWHPSGNPHAIGSAVFIDSWMDDHIAPRGWDPMNSRDAAGNVVVNQPADARFFESGSTGPGAANTPERRRLTPEQRSAHTLSAVLGGWTPN
ncbi:MAG TPA: pectate lyase [Longimicrobium sp.]|jgi:PelA/Pel-15E family pectate lyase